MKKFLAVLLTAALLLIVALGTVKIAGDARFYAGYDAAAYLNARLLEQEDREGYVRQKVSFDSTPGEAVPTLVTLPRQFEGRVPCIIFLHGIGQEKEFLDEITGLFNQAGFAMACFDQYTRGERELPKDAGALAQARAFRRRAAATVNDTRRLIDYLETRPDIDPHRIYMVGASYGAITGSVAAAFDTRIRAVVLVYGGGNLSRLLDAPMIHDEIGAWTPLAKVLLWYLIGAADPVKHIGGIAPRPVLLQNGRNDRLVAPPAAEALQAACNEPKTITWYDSDHIGMDEAVVWRVLDEALRWIQQQDASRTTAS